MKHVIYIENKRFYIESDSSQIRDEERYCAIKDSINRRAAISKSRFDWGGVYTDAESLAEAVGIDLIMASYFTVAAFKTQGFRGFANGLALINSALLNQGVNDLKGKNTELHTGIYVPGMTPEQLQEAIHQSISNGAKGVSFFDGPAITEEQWQVIRASQNLQ